MASWITKKIKRIVSIYRIWKVKKAHPKELIKVRDKKVVKVAFLAINSSIWKYDFLYNLLEKDSRFNPVVFICPFVRFDEGVTKQVMDSTIKTFSEKGYNIVKTQQTNGEWLDIKREFNPDLVFFCTPWNHTLSQYNIKNFLNTLTCYVPYGFQASNQYDYHFNKEMEKYCWKYFVETKIHRELAVKYSDRIGDNAVWSGFPGTDELLNKIDSYSYKVSNESSRKKIIWAPHHTIPLNKSRLFYSNFLAYCDFMLELADRYQEKIDFIFKPHPNLRGKLNKVWGVKKTDEYFNKWNALANGKVNEGDYINLFLESDAMIHDSVSFMVEYLYTEKPMLYLMKSDKIKDNFNKVGNAVLDVLYKGFNKKDIINFIENIVLVGQDKMKPERKEVFEHIIKPPHNKLASENIYDYILKELQFDN